MPASSSNTCEREDAFNKLGGHFVLCAESVRKERCISDAIDAWGNRLRPYSFRLQVLPLPWRQRNIHFYEILRGLHFRLSHHNLFFSQSMNSRVVAASARSIFGEQLESNRRVFDYTMYGISAQGGDDAQADQLTEMAPSERILVVGADVKNPHDLTEPLIWLMR